MKFYEEEVISIPAAWGTDGVLKYGVYSCPLKKRYRYKKSLYVAFRPKGGVVTELYKIREVYELIPSVNMIAGREMNSADRKAVLGYLNDPKFKVVQNDAHTTQFYVLDMKHTIRLPHGGATAQGRSPRGIVYYYLSDMLNPKTCKGLKPANAYRRTK